MAATVTLTYNPYIPQLSILVNGKHLSAYSRLIKYSDEDIWNWNNEILDEIYSELRDEFYLVFVGNANDAEIMRYHCNQYRYCIGFEASEFVICNSLQKRLGLLNQYLKKNKITSYERTVIQAVFIICPEMQRFTENIEHIDVNNLFCTTHIRIVNTIPEHFESTDNTYYFWLSSGVSDSPEFIEKLPKNNPIFRICAGEKNELYLVNETMIAYETTDENLILTIFKCFLEMPLIKALRACYWSVQKINKNANELKVISTIEPVVKISIDKKIEVGKSNPIRISFEPLVEEHPRLIFKVLNEKIAVTDNICVFGKQAGQTKLEVYRYGSQKPFEIIDINIVARKRIKKLILSDDELVLGIGDTKKIQCDYSPEDADNSQDITWSSTDKSVVTVDSNGNIKCLKQGNCRVICTAENVSAQCQCEVKPYLQKINVILPENRKELFLEPMQEYNLVIEKEPVDSIDSQITVSSSDYNVANVIGNKIIAKNIGTATITVLNSTKRKSLNFSVMVVKKKGGFLKKYFGFRK